MSARAIFGDFQTPLPLAELYVEFVERHYGTPRSILEPTVGQGTILGAALARFESAHGFGVDRDAAHLDHARRELGRFRDRVELASGDMFDFDYGARIEDAERPLAILGNPPWVTNAAMAGLGGSNLPKKSNRDRVRGIDARTGRSNFDVAEWLLAELVRASRDRDVVLGFLVKTQVARRIVRWASKTDAPLFDASIVPIDSTRWFGASVDACAFTFRTGGTTRNRDVAIFDSFESTMPSSAMGVRAGLLVRDVSAIAIEGLLTESSNRAFRSGVKHDATDVFELALDVNGTGLRNGLGELVDVEATVLYPLAKGGDLGRANAPRRAILLPQTSLSEDASALENSAPRAFEYLVHHGARLDARRSSIYRDRPRFSVFGVGAYSFSPYKVAVFGLAKQPRFVVLSPRDGRPTMLDDTAYFAPCPDEASANALAATLESPVAKSLLSNLVFPDAKRPITMETLSRIDLGALARRARDEGQLSASECDRASALASSFVPTAP